MLAGIGYLFIVPTEVVSGVSILFGSQAISRPFRACSFAMSAYARSIAANLIGAPLPVPGVIDEDARAGFLRAHAQMLTLLTAEVTHS